MTLDRLETIARAAELDCDAVLATGQVTTDSNADYIAAMSPAMTLALIERLREAEQLVQRLWVLARHTDLAMDLWWQASDDNWAVPDGLPSRFLEFSLAKCGVEWESAEVDDRLAAVDALHSPRGTAHEEDWACYEDARDWPCPTHLAVNPECADGCEHTP